MDRVELEAEAVRGDLPGGVAIHRQCICDRSAKQGIAERCEHQPESGLADVMLLVADAELGDERPDRFQDRVQRIPVAGQDHPGGKRPRTFPIEGIEGQVDDLPRVRLVSAGSADGLGDIPGNPVGNQPCKLGLKACRRPEMVEKVRVGPTDFRCHRFQCDGLWTLFEQYQPRGLECGGPALFGVEALSTY